MTRDLLTPPTQQSEPKPRPVDILATRPWLVWAAPVVLTLAICCYQATRAALWTDELATWSAARRPLGEIFDLLGNVDAALGSYYVFMHGWISVFGDSEWAL